MTTEPAVGGRSAGADGPPHLLLAVNRPGLEDLLRRDARCRVVATVRDAAHLRTHLQAEVAEVVVLARGFLGPKEAAELAPMLAAWRVVRIGGGPGEHLPILAAAADAITAVALGFRLRARS